MALGLDCGWTGIGGEDHASGGCCCRRGGGGWEQGRGQWACNGLISWVQSSLCRYTALEKEAFSCKVEYLKGRGGCYNLDGRGAGVECICCWRWIMKEEEEREERERGKKRVKNKTQK